MKCIQAELQLTRNGKNFAWAFEINQPGITIIYGPSGAGKTTLLRMLAGLESAQGSVYVQDQCWQDNTKNIFLKTHQRKVSFIFQGQNLFPHFTVRKNLEYAVHGAQKKPGLKLQEVITLFQLDSLLARKVSELSGGEMQRITLARGLLRSSDIFLMDEPLSALDAVAKKNILTLLKKIVLEKELTILYVTHSWAELVALADQVILMESGNIQKILPASLFIQQGVQ